MITDISGKARVTFALPDNITNYRIIAIANTKDSRFGVAERPIEVRKDYVLEAKMPTILRTGDTFSFIASAFNATKRITAAEVILTIGSGSSKVEKRAAVALDVVDKK